MLLHLPQCVEIIGLNGVSTLVVGFQHFSPLSETVKTLRGAALQYLVDDMNHISLMK